MTLELWHILYIFMAGYMGVMVYQSWRRIIPDESPVAVAAVSSLFWPVLALAIGATYAVRFWLKRQRLTTMEQLADRAEQIQQRRDIAEDTKRRRCSGRLSTYSSLYEFCTSKNCPASGVIGFQGKLYPACRMVERTQELVRPPSDCLHLDDAEAYLASQKK